MRSLSRYFALVVSAPLLAAQLQAQPRADDDVGLWALAVGVQADDESNTGASASFNMAVASETWLSVSAGQSRSPRERADVTAASYVVGVDHRFGLVGANVALEKWGDTGSVESRDYAAAIYFQSERFRVEFGYEQRDIDVTFNVIGPLGREFARKAPLDADGMRLSLNATLTGRVRLFAAQQTFDYSRDLALLPRLATLNLLSASTLTLANSFVDRIALLGFDAEFGGKVFSLRVGQDRSAVDDSELSSLDAALMFPVGRRVDLEVSLGRSDSDVFDSSLYGGVFVVVYGGG
jgi:hypothetical protein